MACRNLPGVDWPFVGREAELARVSRLLVEATGLVVLGPAGVGKTRLVHEAISTLEGDGTPVLRFLATEATRTLPFAPFVDLLPDATPSAELDLLRSALGRLERYSNRKGLVLVVDDAHHLDDSSLALLTRVLTTSVGKLALTVRSDEPTTPGLAALLRSHHMATVDLRPFDRDGFDRLLTAVLGPATPELADELWRLCQGNPLLLRELIDGALDRSTVREVAGRWELLGEVHDSARIDVLVSAKLAALGDREREVVEMVAVGTPAPVALIEEVVGVEPIARAEGLGLVSSVRDHRGVALVPGHPLYGEVLVEQLTEVEKQSIRRRLLETALKLGRAAGVDPLRLAKWQLRSGVLASVKAAVTGASSALARHDPRLAEQVARQVSDRSAAAAIILGRALSHQSRYEEAEDVLAAVDPSSELVGELASARAHNLAFGLQRAADAIALLADAAQQTDDAVMRGRLDAERGVISALPGDFSETLRAARSVIDNADATGMARASAYVSLTLAQGMGGDCTGLEQEVDEALRAARRARDDLPLAEDQISIMQGHAMMAQGRVGEAIGLAERHLQGGESAGTMTATWLCQIGQALDLGGRLQSALTALLEAKAMLADFDPFRLQLQTAGSLAVVAAELGDDGPSRALGEVEPQSQPRIDLFVARGRGWGMARRGDLDGAAIEVARAGEEGLAGQHVVLAAWTLHDATRFGHPELVVDSLEAAASLSRGAHLIEAVAAGARAYVDGDPGALSVVALRLAAAGAYLWGAETAARASAGWFASGTRIEAARAEFLSRAWENRCEGEPKTSALDERPDLVTTREVEVALQAVGGRTSPEIASDLYLSPRTVDNHLGAVYRKLQLDGRQGLSEFWETSSAQPTVARP